MSFERELLILHISDLHVTDERCVAVKRLTQIAGAVGTLWSEECTLLIILSGDLAYSGKAKEYEIFKEALDELIGELTKRRFNHIYIYAAPGNHDCDFGSIDPFVQEALLAGMGGKKESINGIIDALVKTQSAFREFSEAVCSSVEKISPLLSLAAAKGSHRSINLMILNTSWSSRLSEKAGTLRMPMEALPEVTHSTDLTIAVLHHPLNWYTPEDGRALSEWLDRNVDMALWGHEHRLDDFIVSRKKYGSTVRHILALPMQDEKEVCGFQCLRLSADEGTLSVHGFQWHGEKISSLPYESEVVPSNPGKLVGKIRLKRAFNEMMEDVGGAFKHPRLARQMYLSDVFVAPEFKLFNPDRSAAAGTEKARSLGNVYGDIFLNDKTAIFGQEQSGKTSLARNLVAEARHRGITPIYMDGRNLKSVNRGEVTAWINNCVEQQYEDDCAEQISYLDPGQKIILLDGFERLPGAGAGASLVLDKLKFLASKVVIFTSQDPAITMLASNSSDNELPLKGAKWYELLPLGHKRRGELIRRWAALGRDPSIDSEMIEAEVRQIKMILDRALGRNFMPKYPFFLLILLQQLEIYRDNKTAVTNGSHGHLFEALINQALDQNVTTHHISIVHDLLSRLAFVLWARDEPFISEGGQNNLVSEFRASKLVAINLPGLLAELDRAKIIKLDPEGISFRYPYLYYYYLAKWLCANKDTDSATGLIEELITYIHTERSANVLMFVAHLGHEDWVLSYLLPFAKSLFFDQKPACLGDRSTLAGKFNDAENRQVLLLGDPAKVSDHHHDEDDYEENSGRSNSDAIDEDYFKFNTATRVIQLLGQILLSRAGGVSAAEKIEVSSEAIGVARRLMTVLYTVVEESADTLAREASDAVEKKLKLDKVAAVAVANRFVGAIVSGIAVHLITKTADSFASAELLPLIEELELRSKGDLDIRLFMLVARLVAEKSYPKEKIDDFLREIKSSDVLLRSTLAWAVNRQFYLQPPPRSVRDSACKKLGIVVRQLPPSFGRREDN